MSDRSDGTGNQSESTARCDVTSEYRSATSMSQPSRLTTSAGSMLADRVVASGSQGGILVRLIPVAGLRTDSNTDR